MNSVRHPDRIAELRELIAAVPDIEMDELKFEELVSIRERLWSDEDDLDEKLGAGEISPQKYYELTSALTEIAMMQARDILGPDFNKIFGEAGYCPQALVDGPKFLQEYQHQQKPDSPQPMSF